MLAGELKYQILKEFRFEPTSGQSLVIDTFARFMTSRVDRPAMILRGSAGTGKTSLAGAIVRTMKKLRQSVVLLAPTGRAAKVFSVNAGSPAYTIHRRIYRQRTFAGDGGQFCLNYNSMQDTLFMVDEASMVTAGTGGQMSDGVGCLLDDLIRFVYEGRNCCLMFIGDKAQLPPVGEEGSPALARMVLDGYGLEVFECDLDEVLRQSRGSGILWNATMIRLMITHDEVTRLPEIRFHGFADIHVVSGNELIECLSASYSNVGTDETVVITRSNKRANIYNMGIRNSVLDREEELTTGDMLMVVKNNYFYGRELDTEERGERRGERDYPCGNWADNIDSKDYSLSPLSSVFTPPSSQASFIANGDRAIVQRVRNVRELYGFRFADLWLRFPDYGDAELLATVIMDSLLTDAPALTREQNERLFNAVMEDYADIPRKAERIRKIRQDAYYNALQVKYAYAVTCHKAQGGQWAHVYLDQGYMTAGMLTPGYIHWLYTAFTRATEHLYLVNWPEEQTEENVPDSV